MARRHRPKLTRRGLAAAVALALTAAAQAPPAPVHNVLPLLDADKPVFGQFVNYLGVGSDRESAVGR